ncbi:MAG: DNA polymerase III subunit delta [Thermoleophilaceae bacterium]
MADLKPVYLIHGDDDAKIDEWRTRVRRRAEAELGPGGLEIFDARVAAPDDLVAALHTLSFATGTRYMLAEDVSAWKAGDIGTLADVLVAMPPDTVLVLVVRGKPLKALLKAVEKADGEVREHGAPKPWEMPRWVSARAAEQGLRIGSEAAKELVAVVGAGQQRLAREIEKLALAVHPATEVTPEDVEEMASGEALPKVYDLADAVVAGDLQATLSLAEELGLQEAPGRLVYPVIGRLREVHRVLGLIDSGVAEKDLAASMKMPPWRAKKAIALARRADRESLERALCRFADLELDLRGGGTLDEATAVTLTLARAAD